MTTTTKELMTLPEFLGLYSISRTAAYREIACGRLHVTKCAKRTLIAKCDAEAWLERLRADSRRTAGGS